MRYAPLFRHEAQIPPGKSGGKKIGLVTAALDDYDSVRNTGTLAQKVAALRAVSKAAAWWLSNKAAKTKSDKTNTRRAVVEALLDEALTELEKFSPEEALYARKKCGAIRKGSVVVTKTEKSLGGQVKSVSFAGQHGATKELDSSYRYEREAFVKGKKTSNPPSAGAVHGVLDSAKRRTDAASLSQAERYVINKQIRDWDSLKFSQFEAIADMLNGGPKSRSLVAYLKRTDRLKYLLSYEGGEFEFMSGADLTKVVTRQSNGFIKYGLMYAMDRYGNLYAADFAQARKAGGESFFNHSSFCGGSEVICAGVLAINEKGTLLYIDNASGHYKPAEDDLMRCLQVLSDSQVDLSRVRVFSISAQKNYIGDKFLQGQKEDWPSGWSRTLKIEDAVQG